MKENSLKYTALVFTVVMIVALIVNEIYSNNYKLNPKQAAGSLSQEEIEEGVSLQQLYGIINSSKKDDYRFIDLRSPGEFRRSHIPQAVNIPFDELLNKSHKVTFKDDTKINVLYSKNEVKASDAWLLLKQMGYDNVHFLYGGYEYAKEYVLKNYVPSYGHYKSEKPKFDFTKYFSGQEQAPAKPEPVQTETIQVEGGC
ncbi:MAG: rhodanese-like domain-containing protein [Bacteroidales bacterium]|nr:rhodanese-like domain-containing protein [Bacteroidales bacterium]